jgi:hypothetical protein
MIVAKRRRSAEFAELLENASAILKRVKRMIRANQAKAS